MKLFLLCSLALASAVPAADAPSASSSTSSSSSSSPAPPPTTAPEPPPAAPPPAGAAAVAAVAAEDRRPQRHKVLVLEPTSVVFDTSTRKTIAGLVGVELSRLPGLDVVTAADVERLAELEGERQNVGCEAASCLAELASAMGARYVVHGDLGKLGSTVILNLNLFDSETATALRRTVVQGTIDDLAARLPEASRTLAAPLVDGDAGAATAVENGAGGVPAVVGIALGVVGALVGVGGVAFDTLSPTSANGAWDIGDAVGPVGLAVGLGLVGTGAALAWSASPPPAAPSTVTLSGEAP
jgi:hypothetical protein